MPQRYGAREFIKKSKKGIWPYGYDTVLTVECLRKKIRRFCRIKFKSKKSILRPVRLMPIHNPGGMYDTVISPFIGGTSTDISPPWVVTVPTELFQPCEKF